MSEELSRTGWPVVCKECGYRFGEGEEYYVVQHVALKQENSIANRVEVLDEKTICMHDCTGDGPVEV